MKLVVKKFSESEGNILYNESENNRSLLTLWARIESDGSFPNYRKPYKGKLGPDMQYVNDLIEHHLEDIKSICKNRNSSCEIYLSFVKLITGVVINIKFPEIKSAEYIFNYYHRDYVTNGGEFVRMKDSQKELESSLDNFIKSLNV